MSRDDLHVAILAAMVLLFYVGYLIHPDELTKGLVQGAFGGLLTLLVTKGASQPK